jgi:predicted glycoside hydrolase/deacetylase ChbG (UPF0249 family)
MNFKLLNFLSYFKLDFNWKFVGMCVPGILRKILIATCSFTSPRSVESESICDDRLLTNFESSTFFSLLFQLNNWIS